MAVITQTNTDPEVGGRWSARQQWRLSKRAASQRCVPHVSSCWLMGLHVGQDSVSFQNRNAALCGNEAGDRFPTLSARSPESTLKMKSVRNVRWMWRRGSTMRPFFSPLKCDILPFVFPPRGLYLWMKERAEWSTCSSGSSSRDGGEKGWMSGNTHTNTHRNLYNINLTLTLSPNMTNNWWSAAPVTTAAYLQLYWNWAFFISSILWLFIINDELIYWYLS